MVVVVSKEDRRVQSLDALANSKRTAYGHFGGQHMEI